MNAEAIRKLRYKFILISMVSIFLVMLFVGTVINVASYIFVAGSIRRSLNDLIAQEGVREGQTFNPWLENIFSPEYNQNHFFLATFNADGVETEKRGSITGAEEIATVDGYVSEIYEGNRTFGRRGNYYYLKQEQEDGTVIAVLDCSIELFAIYRILVLTVAVSMVALLITYLLVWRFSAKAVRPEIENNRRQREFITNASHELKTPLAVIRANTELVEMTAGESEWTQSTLNQVERMEGLIKNLVMMARSQEQVDKSAISDVDVTKVVGETVDTYEAVARQTGKTLARNLAQDVHLVFDEAKVRQLTTILVDNAMKYCDEGGTIRVSVAAEKKSAVLVVSNSYQAGKDVDYSRFFDRFYRHDASHNIDSGGYGIGLSIADTICKQNKGSIRAEWQDGVISFICILKPQLI